MTYVQNNWYGLDMYNEWMINKYLHDNQKGKSEQDLIEFTVIKEINNFLKLEWFITGIGKIASHWQNVVIVCVLFINPTLICNQKLKIIYRFELITRHNHNLVSAVSRDVWWSNSTPVTVPFHPSNEEIGCTRSPSTVRSLVPPSSSALSGCYRDPVLNLSINKYQIIEAITRTVHSSVLASSHVTRMRPFSAAAPR